MPSVESLSPPFQHPNRSSIEIECVLAIPRLSDEFGVDVLCWAETSGYGSIVSFLFDNGVLWIRLF